VSAKLAYAAPLDLFTPWACVCEDVDVIGPSGTLTFLFTDIEGSTRLWQLDESAMRNAVARHDMLVRKVIADLGGTVFSGTGDGVAAVFGSASSAVKAALAAQAQLAEQAWPTPDPVRVRMGLHTGEAECRDGDYFGTTVNRAARVMAVGHGGQVLCSSATASLVEAGTSLVDLGEHRLRDLDRTVHLYQVGEGSFSPLRSLDAFPGNLPAQLTSFVGRGPEMLAVYKALSASRLVTLTGTGGVGKTRLAVQVAADAVTGFPDGRWLCELAVASDPDAMAQVIAVTLGLTPRQGVALPQGIAEFIGTRRLLLLLDNCEHLLDPAAELVGLLLGHCPHARIVATSREAFGVPGEHVIRVRSLSVPQRGAPLEELANVEATRLFIDRAEAAGASVDFAATDGHAIAEICRRLDGIPLAIELAAARVTALSPTEVAAHLDERFRLLTGGRRAALERHHTLRAAVDWSYALLGDTERNLFDRLGVFPASFGAAAAQAVAADCLLEEWDALDSLASLVAKSMLVAERHSDGSTRYQMLETLRHYARERLHAAGLADACRRAHARYYATVAAELISGMQSNFEVAAQSMSVELDNFRAAVSWGLDSGDDADADLAMCIIASVYACGVGGSSGIHAWAEQAVDRIETSDARYRGLVLGGAAVGAYFRGEFIRGRELAEEAVRAGVADSLFPAQVLTPALIFANPDELAALIERGVRMLDEAHADPVDYGQFHGAAAIMAAELGHMTVAQDNAGRAAAKGIQAKNNGLWYRVLARYAFGRAWWETKPEAALAALRECVSVPLLGGHFSAVQARALALIAQLQAGTGDYPAALEALRRSIAKAHADGDRPSMANAFARGATVMNAVADQEAAALFCGAVARGALAKLYAVPLPERAGHRELLSRLRAALGDDAYEAAASRGAAMAYDELVAFALHRLESRRLIG
jgi:predicted ATPase/class 3 adenylate cyclase